MWCSRIAMISSIAVVILQFGVGANSAGTKEKKVKEEKAPDYLKKLLDTYGTVTPPSPSRPSKKKGPKPQLPEANVKFAGEVEKDSLRIGKYVIPRARIYDRNAIAYLAEVMAVPDLVDSIGFIDIYDFARSGFGNGDLMIVSPSGYSDILAGLSKRFKNLASEWFRLIEFIVQSDRTRQTNSMNALLKEVEQKQVETASLNEAYEPEPNLPPEENQDKALDAIFSGIHMAIKEQYGLYPIKLYFERDSLTTTLEVWGYDPLFLEFKPLRKGLGANIYDVLTVTRIDSLKEVYKTYIDAISITREDKQTIFMPAKANKRLENKPWFQQKPILPSSE